MAVPIPNCAHAIKKGGIKEIHQPMLGMKPMKNARMPHSGAKGIPNTARMSVSPMATMKLITVMILTYWRTSTVNCWTLSMAGLSSLKPRNDLSRSEKAALSMKAKMKSTRNIIPTPLAAASTIAVANPLVCEGLTIDDRDERFSPTEDAAAPLLAVDVTAVEPWIAEVAVTGTDAPIRAPSPDADPVEDGSTAEVCVDKLAA